MDELRAALGLVQLKKLPEWNEIRQRLSVTYRELMAEHCPSVMIPIEAPWPSTHHLMPVVLTPATSRQRIIDRLRKPAFGPRSTIRPSTA
jgi:dTDP-4-amino-4,6-dideoxygalactose transaminase